MCDLLTHDQQAIEQKLDTDRLKKQIPMLKELMFEDVAGIQSKLRVYLAECGIKFLIVKHFSGAPVQGVIKYADVFWFTFFHEIGHIVNGDIQDKLIHYDSTENEVEDRADEFAANTLIHPAEYEIFVKKEDYSLPSIRHFCGEQNIPPYILIGRLQRDKYLKYSQYSAEKVRYNLGH
jgi:HTH-type transcriptional regulator/antitoxin HigA